MYLYSSYKFELNCYHKVQKYDSSIIRKKRRIKKMHRTVYKDTTVEIITKDDRVILYENSQERKITACDVLNYGRQIGLRKDQFDKIRQYIQMHIINKDTIVDIHCNGISYTLYLKIGSDITQQLSVLLNINDTKTIIY